MGGEADVGVGLDRYETWFLSLADQVLSGPLAAGALGVALLAGVLHALGPGHGKTIMVSYLAGTDARVPAAASVGVVVAAMHSLSAVVLGGALYVLVGSSATFLGVAVPVMSVAAGALVMTLGGTMLWRQLGPYRPRRVSTATPTHAALHPHGHDPTAQSRADDPHQHGHSHELPPSVSPMSLRGMATIGVAGGLLPSPSSFLVLSTAIFAGRPLVGFALVLAFGVGIALTLTLVGLLTVRGRRMLLDRSPTNSRACRLARHLPLASSFAVTAAGVWVIVISLLRL